MITLIAAAAENNALGQSGDLPWHLPDDFKRFKRLTSGHHILMGRKTFESFPKLLPHREHVVITRQQDYDRKGIQVVHRLSDGIELAREDDNIYIIGGGEIYAMALNVATHIELTRVHAVFEADTFFPILDLDKWNLVHEEYHPKDERHAHAFTYLTYARK